MISTKQCSQAKQVLHLSFRQAWPISIIFWTTWSVQFCFSILYYKYDFHEAPGKNMKQFLDAEHSSMDGSCTVPLFHTNRLHICWNWMYTHLSQNILFVSFLKAPNVFVRLLQKCHYALLRAAGSSWWKHSPSSHQCSLNSHKITASFKGVG